MKILKRIVGLLGVLGAVAGAAKFASAWQNDDLDVLVDYLARFAAFLYPSWVIVGLAFTVVALLVMRAKNWSMPRLTGVDERDQRLLHTILGLCSVQDAIRISEIQFLGSWRDQEVDAVMKLAGAIDNNHWSFSDKAMRRAFVDLAAVVDRFAWNLAQMSFSKRGVIGLSNTGWDDQMNRDGIFKERADTLDNDAREFADAHKSFVRTAHGRGLDPESI